MARQLSVFLSQGRNFRGTTGYTGSQGATGFTGSQGIIGYTGSGATNADQIDNYHVVVTASLPGSPDASTIYFITG